MTAQKTNISAIKASLTKIAQDLESIDQSAVSQAPASGSPEEVMELIDNAIEVLEVAQESVPAEKQEEVQAAAPIVAKTKTKSAQDEDEDEDKDKDKDGEQKDAQDDKEDDEDEEKKEMTARIAILEGELTGRQKEAIAKEFVELYPSEQRQAKFDEIMASDTTPEVLTAQFKVAKDVVDNTSTKTARHVPVKSQSGYLVKKARMEQVSIPAWRT